MKTNRVQDYAVFIALTAVICSGCSTNSDVLQAALGTLGDQRDESHLTSFGETDEESMRESGPFDAFDGGVAEEPATMESVPFPDRENPFEFAGDQDLEGPQIGDNRELEIKLYGFAGSPQVKAILNIGGHTKMLAAGETWNGLEVVDVSPPNVKIKSEGVLRVWSILGRREMTNAP
jgi:hypothetical protein